MTQKDSEKLSLCKIKFSKLAPYGTKGKKLDNLYDDIRSLRVKFYIIKFSQMVLQEMHEDKLWEFVKLSNSP